MNGEATILMAEDDQGHATLVRRNLRRAGITNDFIHFKDGQEILDFLQKTDGDTTLSLGVPYLLLLDIRMPKVDGVEVLRRVKSDRRLRRMPVVMVTTTDDPAEVAECHSLGCNHYITKPVEYGKFVVVIRQLGLFLSVVEVPHLRTEE
jgi:CheY-like chemotaxis protein